MSRPFFLSIPAACAALSVGFSACVGTIYDRMYSNKTTHFKKPQNRKEASAEDLLGPADKANPQGAAPGGAGGALPPAGSDIPGLPAATPDAAAPGVPPPAM